MMIKQKMDISSLVAPHILKLRPYSSARSEFKGTAKVFLDANENPLRTPYNRYPDPLQLKLKNIIASNKGCLDSQVFLGNGSDEAIDLIVRIFCKPYEDAIITMPPTYGMYSVSAAINAVENIQIPLNSDFQPDVDAVLSVQNNQTKVLFICSPNNPTGNDIELDKIIRLVEGFSGIVVVDEAYIDFSEQSSMLSLLEKYPNLIVLQTFSKAWGLAAIRLGMAFASEEIIAWFNKVKPPYNVNTLTQEYALNVLSNKNTLKQDVSKILKERQELEKQLNTLPFILKVYSSATNFILIRTQSPDLIYEYLVSEGIIVRNRNKVLLCAGCLRITVGTKEENDLLISKLKGFKK